MEKQVLNKFISICVSEQNVQTFVLNVYFVIENGTDSNRI